MELKLIITKSVCVLNIKFSPEYNTIESYNSQQIYGKNGCAGSNHNNFDMYQTVASIKI